MQSAPRYVQPTSPVASFMPGSVSLTTAMLMGMPSSFAMLAASFPAPTNHLMRVTDQNAYQLDQQRPYWL